MPERSRRRQRRPALSAALVVAVVAAVTLYATYGTPAERLPPTTAIRDALRSRTVRDALIGTRHASAAASRLDGSLTRVTFAAGGRVLVGVDVAPDGSLGQVQSFRGDDELGNGLAATPATLVALGVLCAVMLGCVPLCRLRNLDLLAVLSTTISLPLFDRGYLDASVLSVLPALIYLLARCLWIGLRPSPAPPRSMSAFDVMTRRVGARRVVLLRLVLVMLVFVLVLIAVGTPRALDVPYAVMEGATVMLHGILPYGHMPGDVIHGDTYPILSYALYLPAAWIEPVRSEWDSIYLALAITTAAALVIALVVGRTAGGDRTRGLRAAIGWLSFPPLMLIASTGTTDVPLAAMLVLAVVFWRRSGASTGLLAVAGWFKLAPFALVPLWLAPRSGAALVRSVVSLFAVTLATLALLFAFGGLSGPGAMLRAVSYQFSRGSLQSPWTALGLGTLQPAGQALALSLIVGVAVRVFRAPVLARDRRRIAALSAAILITVQLAANYWSLVYLAWIVPLIGLSLLNEAPTQAPPRTSGVASPTDAGTVMTAAPGPTP